MATYGLNPNGLLDSGMEMRGVHRSIETAMANLDRYVNLFISANAGGGADAYVAAQATWQQGLARMNGALNQGANAIDDIRENYHVGDAKGAALFQGSV